MPSGRLGPRLSEEAEQAPAHRRRHAGRRCAGGGATVGCLVRCTCRAGPRDRTPSDSRVEAIPAGVLSRVDEDIACDALNPPGLPGSDPILSVERVRVATRRPLVLTQLP